MSDEAASRRRTGVLEARCDKCGETFFPASPGDLMHFMRRAGELCGGNGALFRPYVIRKPRD